MSFVFVKTSHDWSDEFDYAGCFVDTAEKNTENLARIANAFNDGTITEDTEFYFGTNEALQFREFEDFMRGVKIMECSEAFYNEFKQLTSYGVGSSIIDDMIDRLDDPESD